MELIKFALSKNNTVKIFCENFASVKFCEVVNNLQSEGIKIQVGKNIIFCI